MFVILWIICILISYDIYDWAGFWLGFLLGPLGLLISAILCKKAKDNNVVYVILKDKKDDPWEKIKNKDQEEFEKHLNNIRNNK